MRTSRLILTALLIFSGFLLATWAGIGFIVWNWNPHQWALGGRGVFAFAAAVEAMASAAFASEITGGNR